VNNIPSTNEITKSNRMQIAASRLTTVLAIVVGIVFLRSSVPHLLNQYDFLDSVLNYKMLPISVAEFTASWLPWMQIVLASCLIFAVFRRAAWSFSIVLFVGFFVAQLSVLVRGLEIDCGCFGKSDTPISIVSVSLVLGLAFISIIGYVVDSKFVFKRARQLASPTQF
jgi:putative oxidoreductase